MKYLVVIDAQNDFITGSLGTAEARQMLPHLIDKAAMFEGEVLMTQDTHQSNYLDTQEGKYLPVPHCIQETDGWCFPKELDDIRKQRNVKVYQKDTFGSVQLATDLKQLFENGRLESVELIGLCTDICVISNALIIKAAAPELPIYVDASCCAGVTPVKHESALNVLESCQVIVRRD